MDLTYFTSQIHRITVAVIGAGGNGSFMLTNLARIDYALRALGMKGMYVTVIDPDIVSPFNVGRQNFSEADIGKFKSEVIVNRINRVYQLDWIWSNEKVKKNTLMQFNLVIGCVDSLRSRRSILNAFQASSQGHDHKKAFFLMDLGNSKDMGQIIVTDKSKTLPSLFDLYPDVSESPDQPSCSMQEALDRQDLFINSTLTQYAGKWVFELLRRGEILFSQFYLNLETLKTNFV